jgi:hypothetical protein
VVVMTRRWRTLACAVLGWGLGSAAYGNACIFSPKAGAPTVAQLQDGNEVVHLSGARLFDSCARVVVTKGVAIAQYVTDKGDAEREEIVEGQRVNASRLGNEAIAAATKTVGRGILAVLTKPKQSEALGAKYFDKPGQVGTPFGDVYIPAEGLVVRFVHLEGDARVQIADVASRAVLAEVVAAQGLTLERARFRPGGRYTVKVATARAALPPGAFEVVAADASADLDKALQAIDADARLDATGRAVARALLFEREGLSFNREITLREVRP